MGKLGYGKESASTFGANVRVNKVIEFGINATPPFITPPPTNPVA